MLNGRRDLSGKKDVSFLYFFFKYNYNDTFAKGLELKEQSVSNAALDSS